MAGFFCPRAGACGKTDEIRQDEMVSQPPALFPAAAARDSRRCGCALRRPERPPCRYRRTPAAAWRAGRLSRRAGTARCHRKTRRSSSSTGSACCAAAGWILSCGTIAARAFDSPPSGVATAARCCWRMALPWMIRHLFAGAGRHRIYGYGCRHPRALRLGRGWRVAGWMMRAVPRFLRDPAYRFIARHR